MSNAMKRIFILCLFLLLVGCVPTPDHEVVVNRADGSLLEAVLSTATPDTSIDTPIKETELHEKSPCSNGLNSFYGEKWNEKIEDGNRQFIINTEFEYTDANCPVYIAERGYFDVAKANEIVKIIAPNAINMRDFSLTKDEIKSNLEAAIRGHWVDNGSGEGHFESYPGQDEEIAYWSELWKSTDDSSGWGDFRNIDSIPVKVRYLCEDGHIVYLSIKERNLSCGIDTSIYAVVQPESWVIAGGARLNELPGTIIEKPSISMQEAKDIADKMVADLGVDYMDLASFEKARMVDGMNAEILSTGWQLTYTFSKDAYLAVDYAQIKESYVISDEDSYSIPWKMEYIMIYIDDNGVRRLYWNEPIKILSCVNDNASVMDASDMMSCIRNRLRYCTIYPCTITVKRIILAGYMTRVPNKQDESYIMPTWVVLYTVNNGMDLTDDITYFLAINAIDGSSVSMQ